MPIFDGDINPVCPYCGKQQKDSYEFGLEDGQSKEFDFDNCELPFIVTAWHSIRYNTKPVNPAAVREYCTANDLEIPDCVKA